MSNQNSEAETFTERCRRMLDKDPSRIEFTLSRGGLETLVQDSERYGADNRRYNALLLTAREIASDTTMMARDSDAWLNGEWDDGLPTILRQVADHSLKTIGVLNRKDGKEA
jgi:hypothetical protein